jgi:hypothetical protein
MLKYLINLAVELGGCVRVGRQRVAAPGEGGGSRLVTGEEQCDDFVAHLLVGHASAFIALGLDELGEEILSFVGGPLFLHRLYDAAQLFLRMYQALVCGNRDPLRKREGHPEQVGDIPLQGDKVLSYGVIVGIAAKERFADNPQREALALPTRRLFRLCSIRRTSLL